MPASPADSHTVAWVCVWGGSQSAPGEAEAHSGLPPTLTSGVLGSRNLKGIKG
jgi:hypothetical protein